MRSASTPRKFTAIPRHGRALRSSIEVELVANKRFESEWPGRETTRVILYTYSLLYGPDGRVDEAQLNAQRTGPESQGEALFRGR